MMMSIFLEIHVLLNPFLDQWIGHNDHWFPKEKHSEEQTCCVDK